MEARQTANLQTGLTTGPANRQQTAPAGDPQGAVPHPGEHAHRARQRDGGEQEGQPETRGIGEGQDGSPSAVADVVDSVSTAVRAGPMHGVQPTANTAPSSGAPARLSRGVSRGRTDVAGSFLAEDAAVRANHGALLGARLHRCCTAVVAGLTHEQQGR